VASRLKHDARYYVGKLYLDAVSYGPEEMGYASESLARASRYQTGSQETASHSSLAVKRSLGSKRMMFGTDHPFFPPLPSTEKWKSVVENLQAIEDVQGWSEEDKDGVRGGNAVELFNLNIS
jgi:predicted TIM-barrel fold metal-dependent hydrolase